MSIGFRFVFLEMDGAFHDEINNVSAAKKIAFIYYLPFMEHVDSPRSSLIARCLRARGTARCTTILNLLHYRWTHARKLG